MTKNWKSVCAGHKSGPHWVALNKLGITRESFSKNEGKVLDKLLDETKLLNIIMIKQMSSDSSLVFVMWEQNMSDFKSL